MQSCKDYPESLSYKYHLAYLLGEALSKADKIWYKGGYFTLNKKIKEAKHIYKLHQEYKAKLQELHLSYCFIPKEFLLDSLSFLKAIETLMHKLKSQENNSFKIESFFFKLFSQIPFSTQTPFLLKHKEEILQWLNSKEFKEQYIKTNHPYPPLLNPERLNAKRESKEKNNHNKETELRIKERESKECNVESQRENRDSIQPYPNLSYESIPAELAWDLNLPLPRGYGFVWFVVWGSGFSSTRKYLSNFGVIFSPFAYFADKNSYFNIYNSILTTTKDRVLCILSLFRWSLERAKFIALVGDSMFLVVFRDPVSIAKTYVNHLGHYQKLKQSEITLACACDAVFDFFVYTRNAPFPKLEHWDSITSWGKIEWDSVLMNIAKEKIITLDTKDIMPDCAFETMQKLAKTLGFFKEVESIMFADIVDRGDLYGVFPLTLYANNKDIGEVTYKKNFKLSSLQSKDSIPILITTYQLHNGVGFIDIKNEMLDYRSKYPYLAFYVKESQIEEFSKEHYTLLCNKGLLKSANNLYGKTHRIRSKQEI